MTIDQKALEATRKAILYLNSSSTPWSDDQVSAVIEAYLAALPASDPDDETRKITAAIELLEDAGWVVIRPEKVPAAPAHTGLVERLERWQSETVNQWADEYEPREDWEADVSNAMMEWAKASDEAATALSAGVRVKRLEEALYLIDALDPEEHIYGVSHDACRGLIIRMGQVARSALEAQEGEE